MANPSTVLGAAGALVQRDSGSDHRNRESTKSAMSRSDVMAEAVFGCARFEHDSGGPLEHCTGSSAESAHPRSGRGRGSGSTGRTETNEKDETYEHEDGAECEHAGRLQLGRYQLGHHSAENTRNSVAPDSAWRMVERGARKSPDSPANSPFAEKAASVPAAAGTGSLASVNWSAGSSVSRCGVGAPRLGHGPQADQRDRSEREDYEVGARSVAASPIAPAGRRSRARLRSAPTFTDVPMVRARAIDAFGSARRRSSIRYVIAVPAASPTDAPVSRRPTRSPGRAFHAASNPAPPSLSRRR